MATMLGSLLVSLGLNSAEFDRKLGKSRKELTTFEKTVNGLGKTMTGLRAGFAVLAGSLITGAIVSATQSGLEYASSLGEVAKQLGVTTKALQEYRYAATQTGVTQDEMDKSLARLSRTIGDAAGGSKEAAALFQRMGINIRDADGKVRDAGDILPEIGAAYVKLSSDAEKASLAYAVFGKSGQKLAPLLDEGARGINNLREAAHELGLVLSEKEIADADETADKIATLQRVLSLKISGAVAANAAAIGDLVDQLIALVNAAGKAVRAWRAWRDAAGGPNAAEENVRIRRQNRGGDPFTGSLFAIRRKGDRRPLPKGGRGGGRSFGADRIDGSEVSSNPIGQSVAEALSPVTGGRSGGRSGPAGPSAPEIERRFQDELARYAEQTLSARQSLATSAEEAAELELRGVELARVRTLEEIKNDKDYSEAQKARLADAVENLAEFERAGIERKRIAEAEREIADLADQQFQIERDRLSAAGAVADTEAERKRIALEILDLEQRYRASKLRAIIASEVADDAEKRRAKALLDQLADIEAGERAAVSRGAETTVEAYVRDLNKSPEQINEAVDAIKIRGLENLNDALVDAMVNFRSLADVAKSVVRSILADLLRLQIQQAIIKPLANAIGLSIPGFANGTNFAPGGLAIVGERGPELVNLPRGARVTPNHELSALSASSRPAGPIHFHFPGVRTAAEGREAGAQAARRFRQGINGPVRT